MQRALLVLVVVAFIPRAAAAQGNPLGPEFRVNTYTTNSQRNAAVASDSSGNFIVVWKSYEDGGGGGFGGPWGVFGQRYASTGAPLGPEFRVNTYTTGTQYDPSVAADSAGNFVVAWQSLYQDGSYLGVFAQRFASSGAPVGLEFRINTYTTNNQWRPSVASDSSGNFVVVWTSGLSQYVANSDIFGQRYAASGAPLGPEFRVNMPTGPDQSYPSVTFDSSGNFVVVWVGGYQPGAPYGVFGQRYASTGAPLGPQFHVSFKNFPSVAVLSGDFVVVYNGIDVYGRRYAGSGEPLGPEFRVNTYTTSFQSYPSVASDSSGNFVVVWQSQGQDGTSSGVFGQRYDSTGAPLGSEFRVNTYTTDFQASPEVGSDASGNFVVVWSSTNQDGSSQGVFGQRYSKIVPVELMHFRVE